MARISSASDFRLACDPRLSQGGPAAFGRDLADQVVADGIRRYFRERRGRVGPFVDRHFSLRGTLAIHRAALGWDLLKAPANLSLGLPHAVLRLSGRVAEKLGAHRAAEALNRRNLLLKTRVSGEIRRLVVTDLLQLPLGGEQPRGGDALARAILDDPRVTERVQPLLLAIGVRANDPAFRARLREAMQVYGGTRAAAAEIATGLTTLGAGALALNKLTPGAVSLGPTLAGIIAQQSAIGSFPLGSGLGGLWYGLFPAVPSLALTAGLTGGLLLGAAAFAALAGIVTDPVQRRLGLHQKRLLHMLDALERQMLDPAAPRYAVRDHYVARLMDVFDILGSAYRLTHI